MAKSVAHLKHSRCEKVFHRAVKKYHINCTNGESAAFYQWLHKNYRNDAEFGQFRCISEATSYYKQFKEQHMTQANQPATGTVEQLEARLRDYERREKTQAEASKAADAALADTQKAIANTRNELGKQKLTAAIKLIRKVHGEAPAGSAAALDIYALLEELMLVRVQRSLGNIYASPFVSRAALYTGEGSTRGVMSSSSPQVQNIPKTAGGGKTAAAIATMQTSVGAGQPRQSKASPEAQAEVGDVVEVIKADWAACAFPAYSMGSRHIVTSISPDGLWLRFNDERSGFAAGCFKVVPRRTMDDVKSGDIVECIEHREPTFGANPPVVGKRYVVADVNGKRFITLVGGSGITWYRARFKLISL